MKILFCFQFVTKHQCSANELRGQAMPAQRGEGRKKEVILPPLVLCLAVAFVVPKAFLRELFRYVFENIVIINVWPWVVLWAVVGG